LTQPDREAIISGFVVEKARSPNRFCEIVCTFIFALKHIAFVGGIFRTGVLPYPRVYTVEVSQNGIFKFQEIAKEIMHVESGYMYAHAKFETKI
jgi:hypothetical protein